MLFKIPSLLESRDFKKLCILQLVKLSSVSSVCKLFICYRFCKL